MNKKLALVYTGGYLKFTRQLMAGASNHIFKYLGIEELKVDYGERVIDTSHVKIRFIGCDDIDDGLLADAVFGSDFEAFGGMRRRMDKPFVRYSLYGFVTLCELEGR